MIVQVNIPTVRKNLEHFCLLLRENLNQKPSQTQYICFVNRDTGDIYFESVENNEAKLNANEWKQVKLQACPREDGVFEIVEEGKIEQFHYGEFTPLANKVMEQMIRILNSISNSVPSPNLTRILEAIANIEIDFSPSAAQDESLLQNAFFHVDRLGAEEVLKEHVSGTYIFRKDSYAGVLESYLPIQCYTLTYRCCGNKVVDLTIVNKAGRWLVYNGDLTFSGTSYSSLFSLLESLGNKLCTPLVK